jgi:acetyl-CoA carboxylase carboxyltransferase component
MAAAVNDARARLLDAARPEAVDRQIARGEQTARRRIELLVDAGRFLEYGAFARPAHAPVDGPADGCITGLGAIDGPPVAVVSFDYTVFGGTMGQIGKVKIDRMIACAEQRGFPLIVVAEGGGARAQDLGITSREGTTMFVALARLSGKVPLVGLVAGPAFAGHANLVGLCDVIVATQDSSLGVGGPPMVEAATGHRLAPHEIGPSGLHAAAGVVDVTVADDVEAVAVARRYLAYFGSDQPAGDGPASRQSIRDLVPTNPRRAYDVRDVVAELADGDSILELRSAFGRAAVTALTRIAGVAVGIVASQPLHRAGALDSAAADKITRFIRICDAFGLPILFLVDTPGFLVGPDAEATAIIRHSARVVHALALAHVPIMTVVLRKAYGLAYYALGAPPFDPVLILEWPTAEYGGMGPEGAAQILSPGDANGPRQDDERARLSSDLRSAHTAWIAAHRFAIDDLIDPADTRDRLVHALSLIPPEQRRGSHRPIDPW